MNISEVAIKRPVFTVMVIAALMVLGLMGLSRIGTDLFPDVTFPIVVATVPYPGASPAEVEQLVSKPIEDELVSLNKVKRVISRSRENVSQVIVQFELDKDLQEAATEVRERVAQTRYKLPKEIVEPRVQRIDVSAAPILTYSIQGSGMSLAQIQKYAKDELETALQQVDGVAVVDIKGASDREIKVNLDQGRIDALAISPLSIIETLRRENLTVPAGHFDQGARELAVRTLGELKTVEDVREVVVATKADGSTVRLRDVARVEDGYQELVMRTRVDGLDAVTLDVIKQSGTNTVAVAERVQARMAELSKTFPDGVAVSLIVDQSQFIKENAHEVELAIFFGGAMAILIILFFMLDLRSMLISSLALPTSVISTFFLMYVLDFTLNMMTLLGLSLAIGLLIDDAVVVRENIAKHLERGVPPMKAAIDGTKEIALSVLATTFTVVAVFVPVAFMSGIVGQFFRQFGLTIAAAVMVSLFVAFTLDPMLSSRFSKTHVPLERDPYRRVKAPFLALFEGMDTAYRALLAWVVRRKLVVGLMAFGGFLLMFPIAGLTGFDFVNEEDRGQFVVDLELPAGTSLDETAKLSAVGEAALRANPTITTVYATLGADRQANKASWRVLAVPKTERREKLADLKQLARDAASLVPGARISIMPPPFVEGAGTQAPIMVLVRAETYEELAPLAGRFADAMRNIPGIEDVQVKYSPGQPELQVQVNREKAATYGIPVAALGASLRAAMEGEEAGKVRQGKDEVPIHVRLDKGDRASSDDVLNMTVWTPKGAVALRDFATLVPGEGPSVIERENRERQIAIWASPRGRSLAELVPEMEAAFKQIDLPKHASYTFDGQIKDMNESNSSMGVALMLGIVFIYLVLASQFESFIHPLTIMLTTLPLAAVGAIVGVFLWGTTLAMGSFIGIIFLMGLVTKNAILVIDRAIARVRDHDETPLQAMLEAAPERLRPILMTSAAMVLGMLPTAVSNGDGSEFRAPMAIAVIGGVVSSTFLSLVVVPAFYLGVEDLKARLARRRGAAAVVAAPAE